MAKLGPQLNTKSGKLIQMFPDFSGGLNTAGAVHQVADNEFVDGQNVDIDEMGSVSKRAGCKALPTQPPGTNRGIYAFKTKTDRYLVAVSNGTLQKYTVADPNPTTLLVAGSWSALPIRLYKPGNVRAVLNATNSGANLVANTTYEYKVVARDAAVGSTQASDAFFDGPTNVSRVTQGATAKQIVVTWDKVVGANAYDVYRSVVTGGVAGPFYLIKSPGNVATWTDTGMDPPGVINPPTVNTTKHTLLDQDATFVSWNDRLYFTSGNGLIVWDGIGDPKIVAPYYPITDEIVISGTNAYIDAASSIHKCRFVKIFWDRLFLCGDADLPQNVYFTDLGLSPSGGEFAYFQGAYAFDISTDNNEPISGVANFRDTLVFFTRQSIHTLFGKQPDFRYPEAFTLRLTNNAIGCESHKSIATVENSLVFVSMRGIYALVNVTASDTSMNVKYLSHKIEPTFRRLKGAQRAVAVYHNHQYRLSFPDEKVVLRWYVNRQAWTLDYTPTIAYTQYMMWNNDLYAASNAKIYRVGYRLAVDGITEEIVYNDDSDTIQFLLRTKSFDLSAMINEKKCRTLYVMARQYSVTSSAHIEGHVDYNVKEFDFDFNESTVLGNWTLGQSRLGWVDVLFQEEPFKAKGHLIYFVISNTILDEPVTIYGLGLEYKVKPA